MTERADVAESLSRRDVLHEALEAIARESEPCRRCHKPHRPYPGEKPGMVTWADPDDGHSYERKSPAAVARLALERAGIDGPREVQS